MKLKKHPARQFLLGIIGALAVLLIILWFFTALHHLNSDRGDHGRRQLETVLRRAAVSCYATEGVYPPNLDYLVTHYGIQIDDRQYAVFYEAFADNLMPDITVLEKSS